MIDFQALLKSHVHQRQIIHQLADFDDDARWRYHKQLGNQELNCEIRDLKGNDEKDITQLKKAILLLICLMRH